jgi:hypothetical protein
LIANGFPKSGTHALRKGLELLGLDDVEVGHFPYPELPEGPRITIFRNPRNCLVSMARFKGLPVATGYLMRLVRAYNGGPMADELRGYLPWRGVAHCVRYEDLVASDACLRGIAAYLERPYPEDAFPNLPGLTMTWTGSPSDWRQHWSAELQAVWEAEGMAELERELGYLNG